MARRRVPKIFSFLFFTVVDATLTANSDTGASTFCFSVVRPGDEAKLLAQQFFEGIGIFGCDEYMIFSSIPAEEFFQPAQWGIKKWPQVGPIVHVVPEWDQSSWEPDVRTMNKVWEQVIAVGLYQQYDWTLKMDAEVAFLSPRLKDVLTPHCSTLGCEAIFLATGNGKMFRQVHALTQAAVTQMGQNTHSCKEQVADTSQESYLLDCLTLSGAKAIKEPKLLADFTHATVAVVCNTSTGSFYRFPSWGQYMSCMGQAGYSVIPKSPSNPAKVSWTRDVLMKGSYLRPTIYCWALVQNAGEEPELMDWQRERGLGIFACDGWMVVSNVSAVEVLQGQAWLTNVTIINQPTTVAKTFVSKNGGIVPIIPNARVFEKAWQAVFQKGHFRDYDWTVKLDVSVAVVPERLRAVLKSRCPHDDCGKKLLQTFGKDLEGPVEALSNAAATSLAAGLGQCSSGPDWDKQPENEWLAACTSTLGITAMSTPALLSSFHQETPRPCDTVHASFHPFPQADEQETCLEQTGYYYIQAPATTTWTTTRTTTSRTSTSSTATTSTWTSTVAKVAPNSIFIWERRSWQRLLPVWVITMENEHQGIPFAIGLVAGISLLISIPVYGLCCRRPMQPARSRAEELVEDPGDPLIQGGSGGERSP